MQTFLCLPVHVHNLQSNFCAHPGDACVHLSCQTSRKVLQLFFDRKYYIAGYMASATEDHAASDSTDTALLVASDSLQTCCTPVGIGRSTTLDILA